MGIIKAKGTKRNRKQKTESFKWQKKETEESSQVEGKIEKNDQSAKEYKSPEKNKPKLGNVLPKKRCMLELRRES